MNVKRLSADGLFRLNHGVLSDSLIINGVRRMK